MSYYSHPEVLPRFTAVYSSRCFFCGGEKAEIMPFSSHAIEYAADLQNIKTVYPAEKFNADGVFCSRYHDNVYFIFALKRRARRIDIYEGTFPNNFTKNTPEHVQAFGLMAVLDIFDDGHLANKALEDYPHEHQDPPKPGSLNYNKNKPKGSEFFPVAVPQGNINPFEQNRFPNKRPGPRQLYFEDGYGRRIPIDPNAPYFDAGIGDHGEWVDPGYEPPPDMGTP